MSSLRRRCFVPCALAWTCIAWASTIGLRAPIDPSPALWAHASGRFLAVLVAGATLVWPATVLQRHTSRWLCFGESLLLALLLGAIAFGLAATGGMPAFHATTGGTVLAMWVLAMGGWVAAAQSRRWWIGWAACLGMIVGLIASSTLAEPWRVFIGPLAAAWAIADVPDAALMHWSLAAGWATMIGASGWAVSCSRRTQPGQCPS